MGHRVTQLAVLAAVPVLAPSPAQAQEHMFRAWFEAPETATAGESFQVWLWATYEVDGVAAPARPEYYFAEIFGSIQVGGALRAFESISPVLDGLDLRLDSGTPNGPWLRDFLIGQGEGLPGFQVDYRNPLRIIMFEIKTAVSTRGELDVYLRAPSGLDIPSLAWWDGDSNDWIMTTQPGVGLITESITVRVIPAPAGVVLLALGGAASRRHRTPDDPCRCRCR